MVYSSFLLLFEKVKNLAKPNYILRIKLFTPNIKLFTISICSKYLSFPEY